MWTVASIRKWQEVSLPESQPNSSDPITCPTNVPCLDRLWHYIQLCWTWKEHSMVNMEVTAGTDRCTIVLPGGQMEIRDDAMEIIVRFVILLFDRTSTWSNVYRVRKESLSMKKLDAANPAYPSCSRGAYSRKRSIRVATSGGRQCYQNLCCHYQLTRGWREKEHMSPTGLHCHKHHNHATSWSLSNASARRLHFSAHASASLRKNVSADSKIAHLFKHDPWEVIKLSQ